MMGFLRRENYDEKNNDFPVEKSKLFDLTTGFLVFNSGEKLKFYNPLNFNYLGYQKFPDKGFEAGYLSYYCLNCQISEEEIAIGDGKGNIFIRNLRKFESEDEKLRDRHADLVRCITSSFSLENYRGKRLLLSCGDDETVKVFDLEKRKLIKSCSVHEDWVFNVILLNPHQFGTNCTGKTKVYDFEKSKILASWESNDAQNICYSKRNNFFISCGDDGIQFYDLRQRKLVHKHDFSVEQSLYSVCAFDKRNYIIAGGGKGMIYAFDMLEN